MADRQVEHEIVVEASAHDVYRLLAEVENWPQLFPPSIHVDYLERDGTQERIRIWATANGEAKNWTSRRVLDEAGLRIQFWQEVPAPPVREMTGTWIIEPLAERRTRVRLLHEYSAIDDDPEKLAWIDRAVDDNSRAELPGLRDSLELTAAGELTLSFTDSVEIEGSAKDVFDFLNEAQHWADRLPHVSAVEFSESIPGLQTLRLTTLTKDGSSHVTESVRVAFPHHRIVYKQTTLPALLTLHTGYWQLDEDTNGRTTATAEHTVAINPDRITGILGADAGLPEARRFLREALGGNSLTTLRHAKEYAESRR
ncbi:aromatase/cyclase [Micromonospora sp. NPDC049204]|uniref:aromatase/cyclase n=1 Tax=unclassified Micromonospora TaxID=2617518 RepID=UPI0033C8BD4C